MILRKIKERKEFKRKKVTYYRWILQKDLPNLFALFSDPAFYKLPKIAIFRIIHKCSHDGDATFRNAMTDFFLSSPLYVEYMKKHVKKFPLKEPISRSSYGHLSTNQ